MKGKSINGFILQHQLGIGGMAEVWYAENGIGMKAAVKILHSKYCFDESVKSRFFNEAKIMGQLDHPNICKVLGFGMVDERPSIIMEYIDGLDMKHRLEQGQRFSDDQLIRWWNQLVSALNYTHQKGIIHRDIKPGNIFVNSDGNVKILDFGIAKVKESISATQTGQKIGTLMYMSPEQVRDSKNIDYRTDSYSLAVTFVHLITGKKPYDGDTTSDFEIMTNIVTMPLDLSGLPAVWKAFLVPYLEKDMEKRPDLRPFEAVVDEGTVVSNVSYPPIGSEWKQPVQPMMPSQPMSNMVDSPESIQAPKRSNKGPWIVMSVLFAILVGGALFLLMKPDPDTQDFKACRDVNDYRGYISEYGHRGRHYSEAKKFVDDFVADSIHKAKLEAERIEDGYYNKCTTIADCETYLLKYPKGRYVDQVKAKKSEMEAIVKEDAAYRNCSTIAACDNYLSAYPNGRYVSEVNAKRAELVRIAERDKEDAAYQRCTTVSACDSYLKTYPYGRYVDQVRAKRNELAAIPPKYDFTETANGLNIRMIYVKGGTFTMGCTSEQNDDCDSDEKPTHQVTLSDYHIAKYEVTVAEFRRFVNETGYKTDAEKEGGAWRWKQVDGKWNWYKENGVNWRCGSDGKLRSASEDNHPVIYVSWNDAVAYCNWLQKKTGKPYCLPTEAQWEYAARGGNKGHGYKYSGSNSIDIIAWYGRGNGGMTHPVGQKSSNELGIYDMTGNVWEWCNDWKGSYSSGSQTNPKGPSSGIERVLRGAGWGSSAKLCRVSNRDSYTPNKSNDSDGFRVALPK